MTLRYLIVPCDESLSEELARAGGLHPLVARILAARGFDSVECARDFLEPSLDKLHDPFLLEDMEAAVERIVRALRDREKILVHGDFDTDGLTATALLVRTIESLGNEVTHFIPNRLEEGYGLRAEGVEVAHSRGVTLAITCDCGINSREAVALARSLGIDIIVTDHHPPDGELPEAVAVVNPQRPDCSYPFKELAGVGVAAKLALALFERCGVEPPIHSILRLCALGTVADVVPLVGENRVLTRHGLALLPGTSNLGLQALIAVAGLAGSEITAADVGFRLAPRLNAMGRFGRQEEAIELFFAGNKKRSREIAENMNRLNGRRQRMVERMVEQADEILQADPSHLSGRILVLADSRWHKGIVGIVASKLVDNYARPALVAAVEDGVAVGSGRSIPGFNLLDALVTCRDLFGRYGGHNMAAGFELPAADLPVLRATLRAHAEALIPPDLIEPKIEVDAEIKLGELDKKFQEQFTLLEPFGHANPSPLLLARDVKLAGQPRILKGLHAKLTLEQEGSAHTALAWRMADEMSRLRAGDHLDVVFTAVFNNWRGRRQLQLDIKALEAGS